MREVELNRKLEEQTLKREIALIKEGIDSLTNKQPGNSEQKGLIKITKTEEKIENPETPIVFNIQNKGLTPPEFKALIDGIDNFKVTQLRMCNYI